MPVKYLQYCTSAYPKLFEGFEGDFLVLSKLFIGELMIKQKKLTIYTLIAYLNNDCIDVVLRGSLPSRLQASKNLH